MIPEGVVEPLQPRTITTDRTLITPPDPDKPWFEVKIWNDGPNDLWALVNTGKLSLPQEVKAEETWGVGFKTAIITDVLLYTRTGETIARVTGTR